MNVSREIKVGLLAVGALLMLYFGFNFLKGSDFFSSTKKYTVTYSSIDGLTTSNPVRINGLTVGQVKSIEILQNQNNRLLVTLELEKDIRVTQGTRAVLGDDGLLGGKVIQLAIKSGTPVLDDGGQLIAAKEKGLTTLVREKTIPVLDNVDSLTYQLNKIVKQFDQTGIVLNKTLTSADAALGTLDLTIAENRAGLQATLANVNRLSASLIETERKLNPILAKTDNLIDSLQGLQLKQTLASVNRTVGNLQGILANIEKGEGSIGKLNTDASFYRNVNATTMSLERLLRDFRENPKRYVHFSLFGRKNKKLPGETDTLFIATPAELIITTPATKADSTQ
ncbi:MAG: MCE family protein [Spirosoma sp.]|nr:MCE family protein [Spirosoma sp.]